MNPFRQLIESFAPELDWSDGRSSRNKYATAAERLAGYRKRRSEKNKRQRAYYKAYRAWALNPTCTHECGCNEQIRLPVCGLCDKGLCIK